MWGEALRKGSHMQPDDEKGGEAEPSVIVRNLGMIKAAAIIMGVLIIVLTAVVIGTVASKLAKVSAPPETISLAIPDGGSGRQINHDPQRWHGFGHLYPRQCLRIGMPA